MIKGNPKGNALYLVCRPCQETGEKDFGIRLGARPLTGFYQTEAPTKQVNSWLWKHRMCGGDLDHFRLGMLHPDNHDQPADSVEKAVIADLNI